MCSALFPYRNFQSTAFRTLKMMYKKPISLLLICTIWLISLPTPFVSAQNGSFAVLESNDKVQQKGLQFRLREATVRTERDATSSQTPPQSLSEGEAEAILQRLPKIKTEAAEETYFAQRNNSLPPPKTGNVIPIKFPADEQKTQAASNENSSSLEVIRFAPEGDATLGSDIQITFSQPMIAVAAQAEASQNVPVQLTPNVKGKWRWIGTKTLIFNSENRLPAATNFTMTVPAGTQSTVGGKLAKMVSWTFFHARSESREICARRTNYSAGHINDGNFQSGNKSPRSVEKN